MSMEKMNDIQFENHHMNSESPENQELPKAEGPERNFIPNEVFIKMEECDEEVFMTSDVHNNNYDDEIDIQQLCECELRIENEHSGTTNQETEPSQRAEGSNSREVGVKPMKFASSSTTKPGVAAKYTSKVSGSQSIERQKARGESSDFYRSNQGSSRQRAPKIGSIPRSPSSEDIKGKAPTCSNNNFTVHKNKGPNRRGPPYACDQCWLVFSSSEYLFKHNKFIHKGQPINSSNISSKISEMLNKTSSMPTQDVKDNGSGDDINAELDPKTVNIKKECSVDGDTSSCDAENTNDINNHETDADSGEWLAKDSMRIDESFNPTIVSSSNEVKTELDVSIPGNGVVESCENDVSKEVEAVENPQSRGDEVFEFQCAACGDWFSDSETLKIHLVEHTLEKPLICTVCGVRFKWKSCLRRHARTHSSQKPYGCEECGKRFAVSNDLKKHSRTHTSERPYECSVCGKRFAQSGDLGKHSRTHTKETPYECQVCGRRFSLSGSLQGHLRTHTKEKPFECSYCGKCFAERSNLRGHLRIHTGDLPFECEVCGKRFSVRRGLEQHTRTHTKEKPFGCELCSKCFAVKGDLTRHTRVHTREKPYSCKICGKKFADSSNLKGHMRSHTNEKPYECRICQKKFTRSGNLKQHLGTHQETKPVEIPEVLRPGVMPPGLMERRAARLAN